MVDRALTSSMFRKESYLKEWVNVVERCKQTKSSVVVWWIEGNVAGSFVTAIKLTRRRLSLFAPQRYAAFSPGEKPPRFQKLSPELCAVLFPAAKPTTAGQVWHPKKARLRCIIRDRELKPAILENRSTTPSCHDPIGSLVVKLLNL